MSNTNFKINFKEAFPEQAAEWDYDKNEDNPEDYLPYSSKVKWWRCKEGHSTQKKIAHKSEARPCKICKSLAFLYPEIVKFWDYDKNEDTPEDVMPGSKDTRFWKCSFGHRYETGIRQIAIMKSSCLVCAKQIPSNVNNLAFLYPEIVKFWDYDKNEDTPEDVFPNTNSKRYFKCEKGHSFTRGVNHYVVRNQRKCKICNSILYTNPSLAREWNKERNLKLVSEVSRGSEYLAWWNCPNGHKTYQAIVKSRATQYMTGCPKCVISNRSREEIYLLFELKLFFNIDEDFTEIEINNKTYKIDIYIKELNLIIEYDGDYYHRVLNDNWNVDVKKSSEILKSGMSLIRVREKGLKFIKGVNCLKSYSTDYKNTANKVLQEIEKSYLIQENIANLPKYLNRKTLVNKKNADIYIDELLKKNT